MPPANSPETLSRRESASHLETFAGLDEEVPDLAFTLFERQEQVADEHNVNFLRSIALDSDGEGEEEGTLQAARRLRVMDNLLNERRRMHSSQNIRVAIERDRRRLQAMMRNGASSAQENGDGNLPGASTTSRESLRRPMNYQGWAPGTLEEEMEEAQLTLNELRALARGHTRPTQDTATRRHQREEELGLSGSSFGRRANIDPVEMEWQTSRNGENDVGLSHYPSESSLRTTALLQSVRRQARFQPSRSWLPSTTERDRGSAATTRDRDRERGSDSSRLLRSSNISRHYPLDEIQRGFSHDLHRARSREAQASPACGHMEKAIKYLESLRFCETHSERLSFAEEGGFIGHDSIPGNHDDFIFDTASIQPPRPTSWLRPGVVFSGSQQSQSYTPLPEFQLSTSRRTQGASSSSVTVTTPLTRSWIPSLTTPGESNDDTWPVKVTIDSVDHNRMTLTGTMEAFNVPNKNAPKTQRTIATYLEGQIIDFNLWTLETNDFHANSKVDSLYWRELEPFKSLSDEELVHSVVSKKWLSEELGGKYVLMRWKEKCFITPSDAQNNLTISGFYYVSLRRKDGHVEGLYYDPDSTPLQHLSLTPARDFPSYQFR